MTLAELAPYLLIALVVVINIALWVSLSNNKTREQIDLFTKAGKVLQKPWEKQESQYRELNQRIKNLQSSDEKLPKPDKYDDDD